MSQVFFHLNFVPPNRSRTPRPVLYVLSPDGTEVTLGLDCLNGETATFLLSDLPPVLQERTGLYLGQVYTPRLLVGNQFFYLEPSRDENTYRLVETLDQAPGSLFSFSLLQPDLRWGETAPIDSIYLEQFNPGTSTHYSLTDDSGSNGQLVYSAATCETCPDQGDGFGLRGEEVVYTYKLSPDLRTATVAASPSSFITADLETNDTVRERYFFADRPPGQTQFLVGSDYPLYIWVNQEKRYLSHPNRLSENGPTIYELTSQPQDDTALLSPLAPVNWRQFTLTPNDFINLAFNNIPRLALWGDSSREGTVAVGTSPLQASQPVYSASPTAAPTSAPFWTRWWFWLIIGLALLLLIGFTVVMVARSRTSRPVVPVVGPPLPLVAPPV